MVLSLTICIGSTVTRIHTLLIAASKSCVTLRISETFIRFTFYIRTTLVSRRTLTPGSVHTDSAKGFDSTLLKRTWVLALPLNTCLSERTFIITLATS